MIDQKLKTLLSVVREGSYTRAADMLSLSQPAVSYHIRQLEEDNEIKIFYHNRKKLTLTREERCWTPSRTFGILRSALRRPVAKRLLPAYLPVIARRIRTPTSASRPIRWTSCATAWQATSWILPS